MHIPNAHFLFARIGDILSVRSRSPWLWPALIFDRLPIGREHAKLLKTLHGFSRQVVFSSELFFVSCLLQVIEERLSTFNDEDVSNNGDEKTARRLVFLDSLITQMHAEKLTLDDIQEEVDTFMFEGHDTTAAALNFFCYLMGCYPDVQAKVHAEMDSIFGGNYLSCLML
jgi:cytochrome P450 family 4 subfamily V